jgi:hypothetical protein
MYGFVDPDDLVYQLHQLKNTEPSPAMTVRVEDFSDESNLFEDGAVFVWDGALDAPRSDGEYMKRSNVEGYRAGEANEGAWVILGLTPPTDQGLIIARPDGGPARSFSPGLYSSTDDAVDAATTYCNNQGGGIVRVPATALPLDYFVVSVAGSVELAVEHTARLATPDDSMSPYMVRQPETVIADTSAGGVTVTLGDELLVNGTEVRVRRDGANGLTIDTESDATINGSATTSISTDGNAITLVYDRGADNFVTVAAN